MDCSGAEEELLSVLDESQMPPPVPPWPPDQAQLQPPPTTPPRLGGTSADVLPPTPDESQGADGLFGPTPSRLSCTGSTPLAGVLVADHKRLKFACGCQHEPRQDAHETASVDAAVRVQLESLLECRLVGPAPDRPATEVAIRIEYLCGGLATSLDLFLDAQNAVALHVVLVPFVPVAGRAMRAALRERWGSVIGHTFCFTHGDAIPALIASRGQQFHESEGELRFVAVDKVGRYGRDVQLRMQAKTIGIWRTIQTYSLNAAEFCLVPSAQSLCGEALCLQRQVDGSSGTVCVEDVLTLESTVRDGAGKNHPGITQRRRYCSGPYCIAETVRTYRFTSDPHDATASVEADQIEAEHGEKLDVKTWKQQEQDGVRRQERDVTEARVTGTHHGPDGHILYSCRVGWSELHTSADMSRQSTVRCCSVAKRYSEWLALDKQLRVKQATGVTVSPKDSLLPQLQNQSTAGRGGSKSAAVIAERRAEIEEWLQLALLHPLAKDSCQLKEFLSSDEIQIQAAESMSPTSVNRGQGQFQRTGGRRPGDPAWDFIALQVHVLEGRTFYVLRANHSGDHVVPRQLQLAKRYSECVKLDNALASARRDPYVSQWLPALDTKIPADNSQARLQKVQSWLNRVGSLPSIWQSAECQKFLNIGSMSINALAVDTVAGDVAEDSDSASLSTFSLRICEVVDMDGHILYKVVVIPTASCVTYNVTRLPTLKPGEFCQFLHDHSGGETLRYRVAVPAGVEENESFPAAVDQVPSGGIQTAGAMLIEKRYSEWVTLDEEVRRHPQFTTSAAMPPRLRDESTLFQSKKETVCKRSAELQSYAHQLAATPLVWQTAVVREFFGVDQKEDEVVHFVDGQAAGLTTSVDPCGDMNTFMGVTKRAPSTGVGGPIDAIATMHKFLHEPMGARPMWGPRSGPVDGWAPLLQIPSVVLQQPSGMTGQTLGAGAPPWLAQPDTCRRIVIEYENADRATHDESTEMPSEAAPALWLRVECRPVNLSSDWAEATRFSFTRNEFSLRPCGGGRGEVLVIHGVHNSAQGHTGGSASGSCGEAAGTVDDMELFFAAENPTPLGRDMQTEMHFVLEVSEHPSGLHEQLTWGLPGEAGSCVTSWVRTLNSDESTTAQVSGIAPVARSKHLRPLQLQMTTADVTSTLLGTGWRVLWEREIQFSSGDDIPDIIGRTSGAKSFAVATALGLVVPIPGFVIVGALVGGVASTPPVKLKAARYLANELTTRMRLEQQSSFGDILLIVEIGRRGHWRTQQEYSFNHGDFWLRPSASNLAAQAEIESSREQHSASSSVPVMNIWTEQILCLRSRIKRGDAVYIDLIELSLDDGLCGMTEQRRVLSGDICVATSTRSYCLRNSACEEPNVDADATVIATNRTPLGIGASDGSDATGLSSLTSSKLDLSVADRSDISSSHVDTLDGVLSIPEAAANEQATPTAMALFGDVSAGGGDEGGFTGSANGLIESVLPIPAPMYQVRCGWLEMKVKIGWTKRYFEMTAQDHERATTGPPSVPAQKVQWKFAGRNPASEAMPPQAPARALLSTPAARSALGVGDDTDVWMRFVSALSGEEYFVNERSGRSTTVLPPGAVITSEGAPNPEPEPGDLLDARGSMQEEMWDIDMGDTSSSGHAGRPVAPPMISTNAALSQPSHAVLSRQKGSGEEFASSRKDLPLNAANVERCIVTIHERTIELMLTSREGDKGSLLLRAVDEADCASWARCFHEVGRLSTQWRQAEALDSIL